MKFFMKLFLWKCRLQKVCYKPSVADETDQKLQFKLLE